MTDSVLTEGGSDSAERGGEDEERKRIKMRKEGMPMLILTND